MIKEAEAFVKAFNEGWTQGPVEAIRELLHPDVKFVTLSGRILEGRKSCVKSIEDYVRIATTTQFSIVRKVISIWDKLAGILLEYEIEYEIEDQKFQETGVEVWTLVRESNGWLLFCRAILDKPSA